MGRPADVTGVAPDGWPERGEGTPKGAFARAGRAADPEHRSAEPVGGNRFRDH